MEHLAEQQIHLEICPSSNVQLQRVETYSNHPLRAFWEQGIPLGINTDDPGLFAVDLTGEYLRVLQHASLSLADLRSTVLNSVEAAFLPAAEKTQLRQEIWQRWHVCENAEAWPAVASFHGKEEQEV